MVSTFQGWRFQRWRQASLWIAKKIRRQRIRGITWRRSDARGACKILKVTQQAVSVRLRAMGMIQKQGNWVPYELKPRERWKAIFHLRTANSKTTEKRFFASDYDWRWEDILWIFYDNPKKKKYYAKPGQSLPSTSTSILRPNIHSSKIMLCIWWDQKGLVYYELLKPGDSITGDRYNWVSATIDSFEPCEKNGRNTSKDMIKLFFFMTTLGLMSLKS